MEQNAQQTIRKSGVEVLRILGIFSVVFIHATGLIQGIPMNQVGDEATRIINCFGNLGVTSFILISGYFGVKRDWKKMLMLEIKVILYSVFTSVLLRLVFPLEYSRSEILPLLEQSVLPVVTRKHWYYSCYMCLLLFAPYLNLIIEKLPQKEFAFMVSAGMVLFSLVPTFLRFDITRDGGKGLVNMVLMYFAGRYIRLYEDWKINKKLGTVLLVFSFLLLYGLTFIPVRTNLFALDVLEDNSITIILICVIALYLVKDMEFRSKTINRIAGHVFGIYILNMPVMRVLNHFVFRMDEAKIATNWMPVWVTAMVAVTIVICFVIDLIYDVLFGEWEKAICRQAAGIAVMWKTWISGKSDLVGRRWLKEE